MQEYISAVKGMVKDLDNFQLSPEQYTHALNLVMESFDGNGFLPQNDGSNLLGYIFNPSENILYKKYISELGKIILFTDQNRILELSLNGYSDNKYNTFDAQQGSIPQTPNNTPILKGKVLASSPCFNWNIHHKIDMQYKITDSTVNFYIVDGGWNEDRYIYFDLKDGELTVEDSFKQIIGVQNGTPVYNDQIDCNTLKWYPEISYPQITNKEVDGGNLKAGVYQFLVSYATSKGVQLTNYKSATNPFHLFTKTLTTETDYNTGKAIQVFIKGLNENGRYQYINLAVAETINGVTIFKKIATLPVSDISYTYTGDSKAISLDETVIFQIYPFYKSSNGITKANNKLFKYGMKDYERFNLQPLAHLFKLKWVTIVAQEGDYRHPEFAQNYRSQLRDEVYTYGIEFISDNGEKIPAITLIGREKSNDDTTPIALDSKDNITTIDECTTPKLKEKWEVYNTAFVTKTRNTNLNKCDYLPYQEGEFAYWESTEKYPNDINVWGDLANTPIRHFKFPDCLISPHHNGTEINNIQYGDKNLIYPIGVKLDDTVNVNDILQQGVNLGYISQQQKDRIRGYKIIRGNRVNNKSITAKGYLYNNFQYVENGKLVKYANYPFNDLRRDPYLMNVKTLDLVDYKSGAYLSEFQETKTYTFHSPDTSFTQPSLGSVLKVEHESFGEAKGYFNQSKQQGEYVILSQLHYNFAIVIAWLMTSRLQLSKSSPGAQGTAIGGSIGGVAGGIIGSVIPGLGTAAGAIIGSGLGSIIGKLVGGNTADDDYNAMYQLSMWISQTDRILELLNNTTPLQNYHWQYQAVGKYKNTKKVLNAGYKNRRIVVGEYLDSTRQSISESVNVNNNLRESSVFLQLDEAVGIPTIQDNSRFTMSEKDCDLDEEEVTSTISSFYCSIKSPVLNQYSTVYSIEWLPCSNKIWKLNEQAQEFGGDTYIGPWGIKRKMSFFTNTTFRLPDKTDIYYEDLQNIAYARYFFNTKYSELNTPTSTSLKVIAAIENSYPLMLALNNLESPETVTNNVIPWTANEGLQNAIGQMFKYSLMNPYNMVRPGKYNIDCEGNTFFNKSDELIQTPTSSTWWKNTFGEGDVDKFIPNVTLNFTGVKGKIYTYNYGIPVYICESDVNLDLRHAENTTDKDFYPRVQDLNYWLQPVDDHETIRDDNTYLYNRTYSKQNKEDVILKNDINFFKDINKTYFQNRIIYSTEGAEVEDSDFKDPYLFFKPLDAKDLTFENGKLISVDAIENQKILVRFENNTRVYNAYSTVRANNGATLILGSGDIFNNYQEFSASALGYIGSQTSEMLNTPFGHIIVDAKRGNIFNLKSGGEGVDELTKDGMRNWFSENLPFKILEYFPTINVDNTYDKFGITLSYDNRFKRFFITKKDAVPLLKGIIYKDHQFYYNDIKIDVRDKQYFCDASWTISYSFYTKSWSSFHSFMPNYYIDELDVFHTGLNGNGKGDSSLWVHNMTNKSFQTYYGKLHPFEIESVSKPSLIDVVLTHVDFKLDAVRYHNEFDKSYVDVTFNKALIYNDIQNSGILELNLIDKNKLFDRRQYPIKEYDNTKILVDKNESLYSFNQFSDIAERNNLPRFINSCNNVNKLLNSKAINYQNLKIDNNYFRGRNFIKLINDKHSEYKLIFKGILSDSIPSIR